MPYSTLGIIGYGNMGSAITRGLMASKRFMPSDVHIVDPDVKKLETANTEGHFTHAAISDLIEASDIVIIAVKPKEVPDILAGMESIPEKTLVISIAAGVMLDTLENALPSNPVIRVMPNTPCLVGAGVSVISRGSKVSDEHVAETKKILGSLGFVSEVPESLMNAVTGLSGSGPAYVAMMIDALSDGGVKMGLPRNLALKLAAQTVFGTAKMILEKGIHPSKLRDMVASPGGTTIEGIAALEANAFRSALIEAVEAAAFRSEELSG